MANILTIAGSDPSGQAGIQGDLRVIRDLGHRGLCAITTVTAQNDDRVISVNAVDARILVDQLRVLLEQYKIDAVKMGLLGTKQIAYQLYRIIDGERFPNIVVDPVLRSSSGATLLESDAIPILTSFLLPLSRLVTPNLDEAEELSGIKVTNVDQMVQAAKKIHQLCAGVEAVLVKGGHLSMDAVDILFDGSKIQEFPSTEIFPKEFRGTGCILSSAIASYLAEGMELPQAITAAKEYLEKTVKAQLAADKQS